MAGVPPIVYLAAASQAAPIIAGLAVPGRLRGARAWVLIWCGLLVAADALARSLGAAGHNNHWVSHVATPLEGAALAWALSLWQTTPVARLTMRSAIPPFLVAWVLLFVSVEDLRTFSRASEPVYCLLALAAAVYTLFSRGSEETEPLLRRDWFWICGGLSLFLGSTSTLTVLGAALVKSDPNVVDRAYRLKAVVDIVAFLAITVGVASSTGLTRPGALRAAAGRAQSPHPARPPGPL